MQVNQKNSDKKDATPKSHLITPPAINLPKGGGAIRGIGEKFAANPVTGTGSMTVPIATSPGRSGFGPQLSLSYDSGAGNGPFGFGWNLSLPSITRKTDKGLPKYQDAEESDVFILSGAEDLVPVYRQDPNGDWLKDAKGNLVVHEDERNGYLVRRYRPRIEGLFARIERWTKKDQSDVYWRSITKDNITTIYGKNSNSRIADPEDSTHIFSWLICESYDDKGNAIIYKYATENDHNVDKSQANERNRVRSANRYLKRILYGNRTPNRDKATWQIIDPTTLPDDTWLFEVVFDYDEGHYEAVAPDPVRPQHRFVRAAAAGSQFWTVRPDPLSSHRAGFEVRTYRRCQRVLMFHHIPDLPSGEKGYDGLVRATEFDYADLDYNQSVSIEDELAYQGSTRFASFIRGITQSGYVRDETQPVIIRNGVEYATYLMKSLPPLEFEYSQAVIQEQIRDVDPESLENLPAGLDGSTYQWVDLHGEGVTGILTEQAGTWFYKRNLSPINEKLDNGTRHTEARFAPMELVAIKPNLALSGGAQFMDLAGDGQPDLVVMEGPTPGFYEHDDVEGWQSFRPFTLRLNRDTSDPNLKFVDLNGDGHADVLITEDNVFVWHPSLAEEGFGPDLRVAQALDEENGPRLVFADGTQSIYLADMCGDGLTDLVRIRNGEVCYWPNLGYGRFGAKVTLDHAPWFDTPDQFDQKRIRLADIDGSGTTDIIYLHRDGTKIYFNQSGNLLSEARCLAQLPPVDNIASIMTADLLGNGTACLVWSSPLPGAARQPMRYIDLMGGQKPHLLIKTVNNLGAETRVHYASSTKFYLADKQSGKPWITRLPFPVHVVERVETYDHLSRNRFVIRYAYHHGYFDGEEREFRGFGRVDQWDTEAFATLSESDDFPVGDNVEESSHVPPVLTKTWSHTGIYIGRGHVSDFFAGMGKGDGEYYREPALRGDDTKDPAAKALLLPDTELPPNLTLEEEREACRALKGSMLRQEVYALDDTPKAEHPYTVTEQNFTICCLQPQGGNRHAVFFTHAREAINYHYERNPVDPRISHTLTLEVDRFGNVLKEAAVGYGRREKIQITDAAGNITEETNPDLKKLDLADQKKQTTPLVTYTENRYTKPVDTDDAYRAPLPCETRTFELSGYLPHGAAGRFLISDFVKPDPNNPDILLHIYDSETKYEDQPAAGKQRRLIEQVRTLYRADNLTGFLAPGELESLALPGETCKLAFTPGLLAQVFQRPISGQPPENLLPPNAADILQVDINSAQACDRGGYVDLDGDSHWWIPSGRIFYSPNSGDTSGTELTFARKHFFLPLRYRDPFHTDNFKTETIVTYDAYNLLMLETHDALRNRVTIGERDAAGNLSKSGNDYRVLQPRLITDPNGNRSEDAFDALGMVAGAAVMGKINENKGDLLTGFRADLTGQELADFINNPKDKAPALLGNATTRIIYDLDRFKSSGQPAFAATLARETHYNDPPPPDGLKLQVSFSYSDGFGREIQKKIQAERGPLVAYGPDVSPRWVGSGWTIFNNKGKPVRQYEPFFDNTHDFKFGHKVGVSPILFYDPVGRVVATLHPNHTYEKVVFDPWQQKTWDVNDTVLFDPRTDPEIIGFVNAYFSTQPPTWETWYTARAGGALGMEEQSAAKKSEAHADTPTRAYFDTLGRTFLAVADNGKDANGTPLLYCTRILLDIEGNQREVIDARNRIVMRYDYDLLSNRIHQASMEAGERWMLNNAAGNPIRAWDSRYCARRMTYDVLQRPMGLYFTDAGKEKLAEFTIYGEAHPQAAALNLRGKVFLQLDGAGAVINYWKDLQTGQEEAYDFKGNLLHSTRRLAKEYQERKSWSDLESSLNDLTALENALNQLEGFSGSTEYDALNRPIAMTTPDKSVVRPEYNEANLLDKIKANVRGSATVTTFVDNINYNAKGQRVLIAYGNGVTTTFTYDDETFRLTNLQTKNGAKLFQNLFYTYDPAGNITTIRDEAQTTIYFDNDVVTASNEYVYDAIYRLIEATGREHIGQAGQAVPTSWDDKYRTNLPHPQDGQKMRRYTELYRYDEVGNILAVIHQAYNGSWTRTYFYREPSLIEPNQFNNRLSATKIGGQEETYTHDAHGNMTRMPHLPVMEWDFEDQLQMADRGGGGKVYFAYDTDGDRVRKVYEHNNATVEERIYLGGYEIYRKRNGQGLQLERETLHIMYGERRIALVETKIHDQGNVVSDPLPLIRYQYDNHLGSAVLELDGIANPISYEEYYPYGSTSCQAVRADIKGSPKRYRYTGKEQDEETGLNYHKARYYAPWLGRWASVDPVFFVNRYDRNGVQKLPAKQTRSLLQSTSDKTFKQEPSDKKNRSVHLGKGYTNLYLYVDNRPIIAVDPKGRDLIIVGKSEYQKKVIQFLKQLSPKLITTKLGEEQTRVSVDVKPEDWLSREHLKDIGTRLIAEIAKSRKEVLIMDKRTYTEAYKRIHGELPPPGSMAISERSKEIFFDVNKIVQTWVWKNKAQLLSEPQPILKHIEIAHELIHLLHDIRKTQIPQEIYIRHIDKFGRTRLETVEGKERMTIGVEYPIIIDRRTSERFDITENSLRRSLGLPERVGHIGW